ncbi:flagellar hook-basal body complex protein FliE [Catenovulum sp. SX2]|uniref:flagellar hook-basal body complex protein FliE n=1 Tax=Catenovulum sp. SX2 TaxID=3398614 RepID=UPI003F878FDF
MKIGANNNLYAEMQALATQVRKDISADQLPISPKVENPTPSTFGNMLNKAIDNVNDLQHHSKAQAIKFEMGDQSVSLADVMIAKGKAGIAFEATVHVRNKVIEAYDKIMQMPV